MAKFISCNMKKAGQNWHLALILIIQHYASENRQRIYTHNSVSVAELQASVFILSFFFKLAMIMFHNTLI